MNNASDQQQVADAVQRDVAPRVGPPPQPPLPIPHVPWMHPLYNAQHHYPPAALDYPPFRAYPMPPPVVYYPPPMPYPYAPPYEYQLAPPPEQYVRALPQPPQVSPPTARLQLRPVRRAKMVGANVAGQEEEDNRPNPQPVPGVWIISVTISLPHEEHKKEFDIRADAKWEDMKADLCGRLVISTATARLGYRVTPGEGQRTKPTVLSTAEDWRLAVEKIAEKASDARRVPVGMEVIDLDAPKTKTKKTPLRGASEDEWRSILT
ncbi:hypothetical protein PsYK624_171920 [Phanerochaete sordida]|uniref:Uncharacterized protein n=1 Tax=Phanerochaete sordida TaxID=48140 RepID=A0A9P3LMI5_9APHY|nr:hypothetical protein PsYK624_171920 [Phanerochaete sordida]